MSVMQVGAVGVIAALLAVQLKGSKTEYGIFIGTAAGIFLFSCIVDRLAVLISAIEEIAEFSSGICRDAGYQTIAGQIEIFCRLTILALGTPVLLALLETIAGFLS